MNKEENSLLAKWLEGQITPDEMRQLEQEVDLQALHLVLEKQKGFDIAHRPAEEMWQEFQNRLEEKPKEKAEEPRDRKWWFIGLLIIAIAGLAYFLLWPKGQSLQTAPGERKELKIADGSKVLLSPGTMLRFDSTQWASSRTLALEGQALFEVSKGSPFQVQTTQGTIEVLGTRFDVWAMGDLLRIQCFEGKVQVETSKDLQPAILTKGQQLYVYNKNPERVQALQAEQVDWLNQERFYQKTPLKLVIQDIERFFAVQINANSVNVDLNFSGRIPIPDLDKALDYLCRSMQWKYENDATNILLSPQ